MRNGIAPLAKMLAAGIRVAIGTDNAPVNDDEDILGELRIADQLARAPDWTAAAPPSPTQLLEMLTVNGAYAAGFGGQTGTVERGMSADLVAISLDRIRDPWLDPDMSNKSAFLARASDKDIAMTMVDGRVIYEEGAFLNVDLASVKLAAMRAAEAARLPSDPANVARTKMLREELGKHYHGRALLSEGGQ